MPSKNESFTARFYTFIKAIPNWFKSAWSALRNIFNKLHSSKKSQPPKAHSTEAVITDPSKTLEQARDMDELMLSGTFNFFTEKEKEMLTKATTKAEEFSERELKAVFNQIYSFKNTLITRLKSFKEDLIVKYTTQQQEASKINDQNIQNRSKALLRRIERLNDPTFDLFMINHRICSAMLASKQLAEAQAPPKTEGNSLYNTKVAKEMLRKSFELLNPIPFSLGNIELRMHLIFLQMIIDTGFEKKHQDVKSELIMQEILAIAKLEPKLQITSNDINLPPVVEPIINTPIQTQVNSNELSKKTDTTDNVGKSSNSFK